MEKPKFHRLVHFWQQILRAWLKILQAVENHGQWPSTALRAWLCLSVILNI